MFTLYALHHGAKIDNAVFLASPLDRNKSKEEVTPALKNVSGQLSHLYSKWDFAASLAKHGGQWNVDSDKFYQEDVTDTTDLLGLAHGASNYVQYAYWMGSKLISFEKTGITYQVLAPFIQEFNARPKNARTIVEIPTKR